MFIVFFLLAISHHAHLMLVCVFWFVCVFPLLGNKQGMEFGGVMSVYYTHFIPIFSLVFVIFSLINKCLDTLLC